MSSCGLDMFKCNSALHVAIKKKVSEDIGGTHELSASSSLFDVALMGPQRISVAVGLLLPVGSK